MRFTKNRITKLDTGYIHKAPKPLGLSGCGIWAFENILYTKGNIPKIQLKAILIEYIKDRSLLICTKMNVIAYQMNKKFSESIPIPKSLEHISFR